ncbi:flagellar FliJ family protein [Cellulomonas citrea]|uniref:flagellar FliJ family protein n=1 Tax=Cellulomonas citrea TaxID=1909423 RepID=UPI00135BC88C|nr:flagellar FliJ family protein [Cellulomonas citrea]
MSRKFGLAGLLRVRSIQEDRAAGALAAAHRTEQTARERAAATARALGAQVTAPVADPATWQAAVAARAALSGLLLEREADEVAAAQVTAERTVQWSAARQATRSVERLAERHAQTVRVEDERAEQKVLDEVASRTPVVQP